MYTLRESHVSYVLTKGSSTEFHYNAVDHVFMVGDGRRLRVEYVGSIDVIKMYTILFLMYPISQV